MPTPDGVPVKIRSPGYSRQMDDRTEIKRAVETVSGMVEKIFDDMEQRRAANNVVVKNLELVKKIGA